MIHDEEKNKYSIVSSVQETNRHEAKKTKKIHVHDYQSVRIRDELLDYVNTKKKKKKSQIDKQQQQQQ